MDPILFLHSLVYGHFGCFHLLGIVSSAALNIGVQVFVWVYQCKNGIGHIVFPCLTSSFDAQSFYSKLTPSLWSFLLWLDFRQSAFSLPLIYPRNRTPGAFVELAHAYCWVSKGGKIPVWRYCSHHPT